MTDLLKAADKAITSIAEMDNDQFISALENSESVLAYAVAVSPCKATWTDADIERLDAALEKCLGIPRSNKDIKDHNG